MKPKICIYSFIAGAIIASIVSTLVSVSLHEGYHKVYNTNIGGVLINGQHIYELVELSDPNQGVIKK